MSPAAAIGLLGPRALLLCLTIGALALACGRPQRARDIHKRGARLVGSRGWAGRRGRAGGALQLAGVPLQPLEETKHFKLIGTTGTGKSTAIAALLAAALQRGDRAVITDPDGGYRARFYDGRRGDVILNPFDPDSVKWDPFAEIAAPWDVEQLATGLIPHSDDPGGREWRGYGRTLLAALLRRAWCGGGMDLQRLWHLLAVATPAELRPLLAGTPAQPFLDPENARMFGSIRAVAVSAAAPLEFVAAQRARAFSVRGWVRAGHGVLFMPYAAAQVAALRAIIAMWVRLAIVEALSGPPGQDQRLWFVVDELDSLGAIDGLKDALTRLRKFGGRCVLGLQSVAQVQATYGAAEANTLIENCGTSLILRCSGSEHGGTAQFASRLIGEREVIRRQTARGRDRGALFSAAVRRSTSTSESHLIESAVLPAEIEQLPDLCGYLKTAASPVWRRVRIAPQG
jgi:type IV secretory pathway TraG/TraD family ATPase VirD4